MSFKDSKIAAAANSAMTLSAELAVDTEEYTLCTDGRYEVYTKYQDNAYSTVDNLKNIAVDATQVNIMQEENSQYMPFRIPRYWDGMDLMDMLIQIRYESVAEKKGKVATVINVASNNTYIRFGWLIDAAVTANAGDIIFEIMATGVNEKGNNYIWRTRPNGKFTVLEGLNYDGIIEPSEDWYTSFVNMILGHVAEAKQYADEAKASAASINVDDIKADVTASVTANLNQTVAASLKDYYTKTEIDQTVEELNTAISGIDSLKNLKIEYDNTSGHLVFKDKEEQISEITINSLSNLVVEYSVISGKGSLVFKNGETVIQAVELSSIEPSAEWRAALKQELETEMDEKDTAISNRIAPLESAKTEIEKNVNANTTAVSEIKTTISNIEKKVESATTKSDEAKNAVDILKQNMTSYDTQFEGINTDITDVKAAIEEIKKNPAAAEYDVTYENSIFTFLKDGEIQKSFKIEGGGGSSSDTTTITIERITNADAIFLLGSKAIIEYSFSSVDNTGDTTGAGTAVWKVGNTIVATNTAAQGNNSFDITEYLNVGANTIRLTITDSFGTLATKTWTVTIVEFKLESTFDDTLLYTNTDVVFRYTPYGNVNKTIHFILDGEDLGTVETQSSGRIMSYNIPKQEHGSHLLKVYMTATINNKEITSNTICKDIICVDPTNRTPIIGCAQQEFTAQQYQATSIKYVVYDPDHNPASVKLSIDGKVQSTLSVNRSAQIWSYKSSTEGKHNLTISCRKVTKILSVNITKLDIDVEPITANLVFDFNPVGKSNGDTDRLWTDKNNSAITLSVSDNFDWDNGGYQIDASGNQYFCVKAGTTAQINYNLFGKDPKQTGSEFKFVFKTQNVRNASATFLSCIDGTEGSDVGIKMDVHEAYVNTSTDSLYFPYSEEDIIEFEYNINTIDTKDTSATSIIMTYEDGVGGRPLIYDNSHRLHQYSPTPISIGSPDCDVLIYRMKAYSASLTDSDILANFIADARDSDEMIARYNRNQIYNDNNALTPDSVANACPNLRIIKIEAPHFTNDKKDFVKNTSMECIYKNGDPKLDNWKFINCFHAGQGTTSNEYGFAARNIDVICCADGVHQINSKIPLDPNYKTELVLGDGTRYDDGTGKISLTRNSIPNNWWNFKVNVASSNMATNALGQKRFNDFLPYESPAVRRDPKVKNSMEFVNCVIFIKESDPDITTHREFQDTDWHFYSLGNMGDSKKTDITRAYDPEDMKEFCIEISDNTLPNSAFQTGITNQDGTMKYPISKAEWKTGNTAYDALYNNWDGSFEFRYDCCGDSKDGSALTSDEAKKKIRTDNKQIWRDFYEFVITSSDKEFKDGLKDWCIQDAMLYFYLVTLRYSMIDNRAKNVFPHWAKHYITQEEATTMGDKAKYYTIDDDAAALHNGYRFDLWAYDMDTQLGINNSGELSFPYGKEDTDYKEEGNPSSGYVFNAAESVLWCRIRDVFTQELRNMYQSVDSNCWSDSHLINEYEAWQNQFPEELWRIHYERLYLRTYRAGTVRFLNEMMNGRGKYHLRQWERDQHIYMGTKFLHTDVKSDQIMFRCNTPKKVVVKPDYTLRIIPYSDMYISVLYGNSPETTQVRAKAGQEYEITTNLTNMDDTAILIYAASRIEALNDLSACYIHDNDFSKASKLKTLIIGNNTAGYQNTFMTSLNMGNNTLLETLDIRNCPNLTGSVNLSACENLINLYADGTIVTSVLFANHGKIAHASLPSSINTLTLKNLKDLTDLKVAGYDNLQTFVCQNSIVDALAILNAAINTLRTVTITGISWNLDDTTLLLKLAKLTGIDDNGATTEQSVLTGTVHVPVVRQQEYKEFVGSEDEPGIWTDLVLTYDSIITQFKVTFINDDESNTILDIQYVDKGGNAVDPTTREVNPIPVPTKKSTIKLNYTFKGWKDSMTGIFADRTITAVYDSKIREYTVKYVSKGLSLQESTAQYGSYVKYTGDTPVYTAEESAYKYNLFKGWDKSGFVDGNKTINAVYETCEYVDGYFDGKDLANMTQVELYTLMKMGLEAKSLSLKDTLDFKLGVDYSYGDIEEHEVISAATKFDGTNYIDTGLKIMEKDRDFTIAIDFEFDSGNSVNSTLAQCFQGDGSNGFRLWYSQEPRFSWNTDSITPSAGTNREIIVFRHEAGSQKLYVYNSNMTGKEVSSTTLNAIRIPEHSSTLVFGCSKADDGAYENFAKGTVHWAKVWYADLGEEQCMDIASWIHEIIPMEVAKFKGYYLSDVASKRANITFVASNLLGTEKPYNNKSTNAGGWAESTLNTWLNTRMVKAISPLWKALIKPVKVYSSVGNKSNDTSVSNCRFYVPSLYEVDPTATSEPYISETNAPIAYFTDDDTRKKAKPSTPAEYESYWTRSPNATVTNWLYTVNESGATYGFSYPGQNSGILLMFSISCEG